MGGCFLWTHDGSDQSLVALVHLSSVLCSQKSLSSGFSFAHMRFAHLMPQVEVRENCPGGIASCVSVLSRHPNNERPCSLYIQPPYCQQVGSRLCGSTIDLRKYAAIQRPSCVNMNCRVFCFACEVLRLRFSLCSLPLYEFANSRRFSSLPVIAKGYFSYKHDFCAANFCHFATTDLIHRHRDVWPTAQ